ncbi:hypothetical protein ACROYT_G001182 [Oculina patagonica]
MGEWTPVFKKGDKTDPGNYRPITVLNSVDKVFESLLSKQIMETMNPHLYQKMSAYRKTHSCETTLIRLTEDWKMAADNKEYVTVLSTDMSKAFDSLHPALMIQKLKAYGFSERALNLLRSFLERRRNRVKLQEAHSAWKEQKRGCPQGSSFGPLLWNLFQNDLSLHRQSASLFMYADDHQIYANDNDIQKAAQTLRRETEAVSQWYKENLLQANPQKYQILTLDPQPSKRTPEYALKMEFDGHEVKSSEYLKILGVTIDNKLTFSEHISDICKKTSSIIDNIKEAEDSCDPFSLHIQKREHIKYTSHQRRELEAAFKINQYPSSTGREKLAREIGVTKSRIQVWFSNRRAKCKSGRPTTDETVPRTKEPKRCTFQASHSDPHILPRLTGIGTSRIFFPLGQG